MNKFIVKVEKPPKDAGIESELVAEIWDADEVYLPDFTPDWLYDILNEVAESSGGECDELMESIFEIDEAFYNAIIKHSQCERYERNDEEKHLN